MFAKLTQPRGILCSAPSYNYLELLQHSRVGGKGELGADDGVLVTSAPSGGGGGCVGLGRRRRGGVDGGPRRLRIVDADVVEDEVVLRLEVQQIHGAPLAPLRLRTFLSTRIDTNLHAG